MLYFRLPSVKLIKNVSFLYKLLVKILLYVHKSFSYQALT